MATVNANDAKPDGAVSLARSDIYDPLNGPDSMHYVLQTPSDLGIVKLTHAELSSVLGAVKDRLTDSPIVWMSLDRYPLIEARTIQPKNLSATVLNKYLHDVIIEECNQRTPGKVVVVYYNSEKIKVLVGTVDIPA